MSKKKLTILGVEGKNPYRIFRDLDESQKDKIRNLAISGHSELEIIAKMESQGITPSYTLTTDQLIHRFDEAKNGMKKTDAYEEFMSFLDKTPVKNYDAIAKTLTKRYGIVTDAALVKKAERLAKKKVEAHLYIKNTVTQEDITAIASDEKSLEEIVAGFSGSASVKSSIKKALKDKAQIAAVELEHTITDILDTKINALHEAYETTENLSYRIAESAVSNNSYDEIRREILEKTEVLLSDRELRFLWKQADASIQKTGTPQDKARYMYRSFDPTFEDFLGEYKRIYKTSDSFRAILDMGRVLEHNALFFKTESAGKFLYDTFRRSKTTTTLESHTKRIRALYEAHRFWSAEIPELATKENMSLEDTITKLKKKYAKNQNTARNQISEYVAVDGMPSFETNIAYFSTIQRKHSSLFEEITSIPKDVLSQRKKPFAEMFESLGRAYEYAWHSNWQENHLPESKRLQRKGKKVALGIGLAASLVLGTLGYIVNNSTTRIPHTHEPLRIQSSYVSSPLLNPFER